MPPWLESYPGSTPTVHASGSLLESTYETPAQPTEVAEHYRKLFEAAGLRFQANPDGSGTSIRGDAAECDLLILIRKRPAGTFVDVNCAAKSSSPASSANGVEVITGQSPNARPQVPRRSSTGTSAITPRPNPPMSATEMQGEHQRRVAEMRIHPEYHDSPAPPLVWPSWLVHIKGAQLRIERGVDQSKKAFLEARYTTNEPVSDIYDLYRDALNSHEYRVHRAELSTGHTISGIQQNAYGYVEGSNYPDGAPGARTEIRVNFSRSVLNGPITVSMRFTAYEFVAPKSRGF